MTSVQEQTAPASHAVQMAQLALHSVLGGGDAVSPASEARIQNALYALRTSRCDRQIVEKFERVATTLCVLLQAKREGRPNLYASQLLRLRKLVLN